MLRFAIYGRPKAFVNREEISGYFEGFNVEMDKVLKSFAVSKVFLFDSCYINGST